MPPPCRRLTPADSARGNPRDNDSRLVTPAPGESFTFTPERACVIVFNVFLFSFLLSAVDVDKLYVRNDELKKDSWTAKLERSPSVLQAFSKPLAISVPRELTRPTG